MDVQKASASSASYVANQNNLVVTDATVARRLCSRRTDGTITTTPNCAGPWAFAKAPDVAYWTYRSALRCQMRRLSVPRSTSRNHDLTPVRVSSSKYASGISFETRPTDCVNVRQLSRRTPRCGLDRY